MPEILQSKIPYNVSEHKKLPGMLPLAEDGWLIEDEAYAAQLAERDRLLQDTPDKVFADQMFVCFLSFSFQPLFIPLT